MDTLQEFLNANPVDNLTDEVIISDRFKDKNGNIFKFKIKAMTNEDFEIARKKAMKLNLQKGKRDVSFDNRAFNESIVINNTLYPDFKNAESIKALGCMSPEQYLNKVLLSGEIAELAQQIQVLSGFEKDLSELAEEVKN